MCFFEEKNCFVFFIFWKKKNQIAPPLITPVFPLNLMYKRADDATLLINV